MRTFGAAGALLAAAVLTPASLPSQAATAKVHVGIGVREELALSGRVRVLVAPKETAIGPSAFPAGFEVVRSLSNGRILSGWLSPAALDQLRAAAPAGACPVE